jgi:Rad3-related DNA helicase
VAAIGGSPRAGQIQMAQAVANALNNRHHLLVQAGTGTGKSLAYLVPALVHGKKVLVATATLALQRQLVERDLPKIKAALEKELNRDISFAIYKGVGNYICLQKLNNSASDPEAQEILDSVEFQQLKRIQICGVMGMASNTSDEKQVAREFAALKKIFETLQNKYFQEKPAFKEISMGMSGDYQLAIQNGSTMVRVGSKIFGGR